MLNWDDYRIFIDVARSGSLSAASISLKIDAATVGRRITRLENALNSKLFNKLPRGYQLTQAGNDLKEHIENMVKCLDQVWSDLSLPRKNSTKLQANN